MKYAIYALLLSAAVTMVSGPVLIPLLHKLKFGQSERKLGPETHLKKAGTPTMGGITFILGIVAATMIFAYSASELVMPALLMTVAFALVGFMDDFLAGEYEFLPALPSLLHWLLQNLLPLAWATLFSAVAFLVISYGVMKRSNAARLGFIVFMVLGTLMNFASIALLIAALDWVNAIGASIDEAGVTQQIRASNMVSMAMGMVSALAIAGLHGWIIWKLCTADVRAQFNRT